ncbi:MAG: Spx/MgsR family RNA polymerase-binding regulatory protein [Verrucomicrobiota bacterium]
MLVLYTYSGCDSCRKALSWLDSRGIVYENKAIRETPPRIEELKRMLAAYDGNLRKLFNVSGRDYRALGMKDRLPRMSADESLELLAGNGNLIKRPFALDGDEGRVGFKEADWEEWLAPRGGE